VYVDERYGIKYDKKLMKCRIIHTCHGDDGVILASIVKIHEGRCS
jgi:hypothetical protein